MIATWFRHGATHATERLAVTLLVALVVLPWHAVNRSVPNYDAADFAITALEIEQAFDAGLRPGLAAAYEHRGWRPVIFPSLAASPFHLADGNVRAGIALMQFLTLLAIGLYVFALARRSLSAAGALTAAAFVVTLPWIVYFTQIFYAELLWMALTAGWLFHGLAAEDFRRPGHTALAGMFLGLMVCTRPVESALMAAPGVALLVGAAIRRKALGWRELGLWAVLAAMAAVWAYSRLAARDLSLAIVALMAVTAVAYEVRHWRRTGATRGTLFPLAALLVAIIWWHPFLEELADWAYETSFGPMAAQSDQRYRGIGLVTLVADVARGYAPTQLIGLLVLGLPAAGTVLLSRRAASAERPRSGLSIVVLAVAMLAPIVAVLMLSGTSSPRRFMAGFFVLFTGSAILALGEGPLRRWRSVVVGAAAAAQALLAVGNSLGARPAAAGPLYASYYPVSTPSTWPEPNGLVLDAFEAAGIRQGRVAAYTACYNDERAQCSARGIPFFEPAALTMVSLSRGLSLRFHWSADLDPADWPRAVRQWRDDGFSYVLLDTFENDLPLTSSLPYMIITEALVRLVSDGHPLPGLTPMLRMDLAGRSQILYRVEPAGAG